MSVLSLFLFNIYSTDLHDAISEIRILQYAYNFCVYISQRCIEMFKTRLAVSSLPSDLKMCGFEVEPTKSAAAVFTRHRFQCTDTISLKSLKFRG